MRLYPLQFESVHVVSFVADDIRSGQHFKTGTQALEFRLYNGGMPLQVDAVYENGVLRPLQPLNLKEHEHVLVSVVQGAARDRSSLAVEYIDKIKRELQDTQPAPGIEEVRRRLAKIPGSMAAEIIAERGER